jgi:hypothetical protein
MKSPYFIQCNAKNHLIWEPASIELLISAIGKREFRIAELYYYSNDSFEGQLQTVHKLPNNSVYTDRQIHSSVELFQYLQQISNQTKKLKIEFKEGGFIVLSGSVMEITLPDLDSIKNIALLILNSSGYSSVEDIWKLIEHHRGIQIPIGAYFFMATPEMTKSIVTSCFKNNTIQKDVEDQSNQINAKLGNALPF